MKKRQIQYTVRNVPDAVNRRLRRKSRESGRSLNEIALDALRREAGLGDAPVQHSDLDFVFRSWVEDPKVEKVLAEQRRIDDELWRR
jgi:hypothetical protein